MRSAVDNAQRMPGISTVIVPADYQQQTASEPTADQPSTQGRQRVNSDRIAKVAKHLRDVGSAVMLLGGNGLTRAAQEAAWRISSATGAVLFCETFPACAERGGGLPNIDRLPYFPEHAVAALKDADAVIVAGADEPVAYFGYEGVPSVLSPPDTVVSLARPQEDAESALLELAEILGGTPPSANQPLIEQPDDAASLTGSTVGQTVAANLPEDAIVSVEGGTSGYPFYTASAAARAHTVLTNTGGAIGQGLPCALGAAIAAPDRPVIALQSDGSGLYTAQALWSMGRERANVVVLIAANHSYNVLRTELGRHGYSDFGPQARALTSLADPCIDWVALANGFGVAANRATTVGELRKSLNDAVVAGGPQLIEMVL
jgi:acetolactate synthase-1/2/3 large subunit